MRTLYGTHSFNSLPLLVITQRAPQGIACTVPARSLALEDVQAQVADLRRMFPADLFDIDQSQVYYARQGLLGTA